MNSIQIDKTKTKAKAKTLQCVHTHKMLEQIDCVDKKDLLHDLQLRFLSFAHLTAHKHGETERSAENFEAAPCIVHLAFVSFDFVSDHKWFQFSASMNIYNYVRTLLRLLVFISCRHFGISFFSRSLSLRRYVKCCCFGVALRRSRTCCLFCVN